MNEDEAQKEAFIKRYSALCNEMGYEIIITPLWVKSEDGSYSLRLEIGIGKLQNYKP